MSKRRGYRITVKANGRSRQILSITESSNSIGTVTIGTIPAQYFSETFEDSGVRVHDRKYSIHPNLQSASTNTIHERVQRIDNLDLDYMSYTKALKVNNCLAPIFARATPDLRHKQYDFRPGGKNKEVLSLSDYNPDWTTLVYCLLLGPAGVSEQIDRSGKHFTVTIMHLAKFDIIILSSALAGFMSAHKGPIANYDAMEGIPINKIEEFYKNLVVDQLVLQLRKMYSRGDR